MYTRSKKESPRRERNGLASHIPLQRGDLSDVGLTATWVDVAPGSRPRPHEHPSEPVYVITAGSGKMLVGEGGTTGRLAQPYLRTSWGLCTA